MPFFSEGNFYTESSYITGSTVQNTIIAGSEIFNTSIDMNNRPITSVNPPVNGTDAANKNYVDALKVVFTDVTLTGQVETIISNAVKGSFLILVTSNVLGGPSAVFNVTRNDTGPGQVFRTVASPGTNSNCGLYLNWDNQLVLYKSENGFDGSYTVKTI